MNDNTKEVLINTPLESEPVTPAEVKAEGTQQKGQSGTYIVGGIIIGEEYNEKLIGKKAIDIYEEMRRSDATVKASLLVVKLPIMAADWEIEPASDSAQDIKIRDFIYQNLFVEISWEDFLREALTVLDFGHSVFEIVYKIMKWNGGSYVGLEKMGFRKQKSIYLWETIDHQAGITQMLMTGGTPSIPEWKLLTFTHEKEGDNLEGVSLLRGAYQHWYIKKNLYLIDALAHEKQGLGVPKLTTPDGADPSNLDKAREVAENIRANESGYVEMPTGYDINFMDMMARTTRDPMDSIAHHDRQIMKNVLAQFLELGSKSSSGSHALSADQTQLFLKSLEAVAENMKNGMTKLVKKLVDLNFPNAAYPTLKVQNIADNDLTSIADSLQKLVSAGIITTEADIEEYIRKIFGLPDLPDEIKSNYEQYRKDNKNQSAIVPGIPATDPNAPNPGDKKVDDKKKMSEDEVIVKAKEFREVLNKRISSLKDNHNV